MKRTYEQRSTTTKTADVVVDTWKLQTFKRHLDAAGYAYTEHGGMTPDTMVLRVRYAWVGELKALVEAAGAECARRKQ